MPADPPRWFDVHGHRFRYVVGAWFCERVGGDWFAVLGLEASSVMRMVFRIRTYGDGAYVDGAGPADDDPMDWFVADTVEDEETAIALVDRHVAELLVDGYDLEQRCICRGDNGELRDWLARIPSVLVDDQVERRPGPRRMD